MRIAALMLIVALSGACSQDDAPPTRGSKTPEVDPDTGADDGPRFRRPKTESWEECRQLVCSFYKRRTREEDLADHPGSCSNVESLEGLKSYCLSLKEDEVEDGCLDSIQMTCIERYRGPDIGYVELP